MERDSFVFYKSWEDAIALLPEADQTQAYRALVRYACSGEEPELEGTARIIFTMAQPIIDANNKRFEDGQRGGRPKKPVVSESKTTGLENENHRIRNQKPNENENVNENVKDNEKETANETANETVKENEKEKQNTLFDRFWQAYPKKVGKEAARKAFSKLKPTEEEVTAWIIAVATQQQSRQWQDPKYIPYPATWLNQKRWEDEPEAPARTFVSGDLPF